MSRKAVINASPLIYLAKIGLLGHLDKIYDEIITTEIIAKECVDKGKKLGYDDALIIEEHIKRGVIKVVSLNKQEKFEAKKLAKEAKIHMGEATIILLAKRKGLKEIIMDDKKARKIAKIMNLKPRGTLAIILELTKKKILSKEEAKKYIKKLIEKGFRISIEVYNRILEAIQFH